MRGGSAIVEYRNKNYNPLILLPTKQYSCQFITQKYPCLIDFLPQHGYTFHVALRALRALRPPLTSETLTVNTIDTIEQAHWLEGESETTLEDLFWENPELFNTLASQWRVEHPVDAYSILNKLGDLLC